MGAVQAGLWPGVVGFAKNALAGAGNPWPCDAGWLGFAGAFVQRDYGQAV